MKIYPLFALLLTILPFPALAHYDLDHFPEFFVDGDTVNAIVVVGDGAPASHVIAQTNIALILNEKAGAQQMGIAKLASEIDTLDQNLIIIGNPCENGISARSLGAASSNCLEGFERGEAKLIARDHNGFFHLIAAGYTEKGTLAAANKLKEHAKNILSGEEIVISIDEPIETTEEKTQEVPTNDIAQKEQEAIQEIKEQPASPIEEPSFGQQEASENAEETKQPEEGFFKQLFFWLRSLFR